MLLLAIPAPGGAAGAARCAFRGAGLVRLGNGSIAAGDIGALAGPVRLGPGARMADGTTAFGSSLTLGRHASACHVDGPITVRNRGAEVRCGDPAPQPDRTPCAPLPPLACPGGSVIVPDGGTARIEAGVHGALVVGERATLVLGPGTHVACDLRAGRHARLLVEGTGSVLDVRDDVVLAANAVLQPGDDSGHPLVRARGRFVVGRGGVARTDCRAGGVLQLGRGARLTGNACADRLLAAAHAQLDCPPPLPATTTTTSTTTTTTTCPECASLAGGWCLTGARLGDGCAFPPIFTGWVQIADDAQGLRVVDPGGVSCPYGFYPTSNTTSFGFGCGLGGVVSCTPTGGGDAALHVSFARPASKLTDTLVAEQSFWVLPILTGFDCPGCPTRWAGTATRCRFSP